MVNIFNSWDQLVNGWSQFVEYIEHFSIFILGYAYKAMGFMKTLGLLGVFIGGTWLWNHQSVITKILATATGEG